MSLVLYVLACRTDWRRLLKGGKLEILLQRMELNIVCRRYAKLVDILMIMV